MFSLTILKTTKTPTATPSTRPIATVDNSFRLQHTIHFFDESTPNSKAKPEGVKGCEIWIKIDGPAPVAERELSFVALDTRSPYVMIFDGDNTGKTAHYWLRWINTRAEHGPWSETASFTISA